MRKAIVLSLALAAGHFCLADPELSVAPSDRSAFQIRSAGHWEEQGIGGTYRVAVWHLGTDDISSRIALEWISTTGGDSAEHILHSVAYANALLGVVSIRAFRATSDGAKVDLVGPLHDGSQYHCTLVLKPGGAYERSPGC